MLGVSIAALVLRGTLLHGHEALEYNRSILCSDVVDLVSALADERIALLPEILSEHLGGRGSAGIVTLLRRCDSAVIVLVLLACACACLR